MRRLFSALVLGAAMLGLGVSPAVASSGSHRACRAADRAGNWEVVLGTASSRAAARTIMTRASAKGLHATIERVGCTSRYEVEITAATRAKANTMRTRARSDGFTSARIVKS